MKMNKFVAFCSMFVMLVSLMGVVPAGAQSGTTTQVPNSGTTSPITGEFIPSGGDSTELSVQENEAVPDEYLGVIDRSLSTGVGHGVSVNSGKKAKSNPLVNTSFEGLNFYQQRYARGGNQFSVEPPDQALCVGNGYVLEAVNDVLRVYRPTGAAASAVTDLNSFYRYAPAINRDTLRFGPFVTDPTCLFDKGTNRWFVT